MEQEIHFEMKGDTMVVYLPQELDHHGTISIRQTADHILEQGKIRTVVFDFEHADFMDSSGIGLLTGRYRKAKLCGGKVAVSHVGCRVNRIFELSGLYQIMDRYDTAGEAVEAMKTEGRRSYAGR